MNIKIFSFMLSAVLLLNICENSITAAAVDGINYGVQYIESSVENNSDDYSARLSNLLSEYPVENGFEKIVVDCENNSIQKNDEEATELNDANSGNNLPVDSILEAAGYSEEEYKDINSSAKNDAKLLQKYNLETKYIGNKIVITNPYQTKRLIVTTKSSKRLNNYYSAVECIFNGENEYVLQYKTENAAKSAFNKFKNDNKVISVVFDEIVSVNAISVRNGAELINSDRYKNYLKSKGKNSKVVVAVVDTGVDTSHEFLKGRLLKGYNAYTKKSDVKDGNGHGTHVSGIVVDNTPSNVKILPVKVMKDDGTGTSLAIKLGIEYAVKKGANVINLSLGGFCTQSDCPIALAIKAAIKKGVCVVVAAGNSTLDTKYQCPCNLSEPIVVASTAENGGAVSLFSNFGKTVDLCAPGEKITSSYKNNKYKELSGTSMAAPFISAAAALMLTETPSLKPSKVESKLLSYCADMYFKGKDNYSGAGILNLGIALGDNFKADRISINADTTQTITYFKNANWINTNLSADYSQESVSANGKINSVSITDRTINAKTSNKKVAVFDGKYIIPKGEGKAVITINYGNNQSRSYDINVKKMEVWTDYAAKSYASGKGTKKSPYIIKTPQQLAKLALNVRNGKVYKGKYFKLANDIDLKGKKWISITHCYYDYLMVGWFTSESFQGVFDGANHKIKNLDSFDITFQVTWGEDIVVNAPWYIDNGGLFGELSNCTIKNLGVENAYNSNVTSGILASEVFENVKISNCYTSGISLGYGLVSNLSNHSTVIKNCYSSAEVQRGIFGNIEASKTNKNVISNCFFCGTQYDTDSRVKYGAFASQIDTSENKNVKIFNCFSSVLSPQQIGFARSNQGATISKCYYLKGNKFSIKTNEYSKKTSIKSKEKSFFKKKSNFTNKKNWDKNYSWDFKKVWAINIKVNNGYPYLKANKPLNIKPKTKTGTWLDYAASKFAGGSGTKKDPYLIKTPEQLARLSKLYRFGGAEGLYFKLTKSIDLSAHKWFPIGSADDINLKDTPFKYKRYFLGNIDGNGKTISNMKVKISGDRAGFISKSALGVIKNIKFKNADVSGINYMGIVSGETCNTSVISNCSIIGGSVKGENYIGSITGDLRSSASIAYCNSSASVTGKKDFSGGLSGDNEGRIYNSSYNGKIVGGRYIGGITGGLSGSIANCYSIGSDLVSYKENHYSDHKLEIKTSYSVNGEGNICPYNQKDTKAYLDSVFSLDEMKNKENYKGFDFNSVWQIDNKVNSGYPTLRSGEYKTEISYPSKLWSKNVASKFAGGKGTKSEPYLIKTPEQLALAVHKIIRSDYNKKHYFKLMKDIDLKGGRWDFNCSGHYIDHTLYFDGNSKTISNLTFYNDSALFPFNLYKGKISNLTLKNVKGRTNSCLILINYGTISNCSVSGKVISGFEFPGDYVCSTICTENYGTVDNCSFSGTLFGGEGAMRGAPICTNNYGVIKNCKSSGVGYNIEPLVLYQDSTMKNCSSTMKIL